MQIRLGAPEDLEACFAVDDTFSTEFVWQMDEQNRPGQISTTFHVTRLPRPMRVANTISHDELAHSVLHGSTLLIAEEERVCGYLDASIHEWNAAAYLNYFAVDPAFRGRGVGTRLIRAALEWGRQQKLRIALLDTSTKNFPAISFYQRHGFSFCGFNDQLYPNRDIALFFSQSLR